MTRRTLSLSRETLADLTPSQLEEVQAAAVTTGTETRNCPTWGANCYTVLPLSECHCTW